MALVINTIAIQDRGNTGAGEGQTTVGDRTEAIDWKLERGPISRYRKDALRNGKPVHTYRTTGNTAMHSKMGIGSINP